MLADYRLVFHPLLLGEGSRREGMEVGDVNSGRVPTVCQEGEESFLELGSLRYSGTLPSRKDGKNTAVELPNGNFMYHELIH